MNSTAVLSDAEHDDGEESLPESAEAFGAELLKRYTSAHVQERNIEKSDGENITDRVSTTDQGDDTRKTCVVRDVKFAECGCPIYRLSDFVKSKYGLHCRSKEHQRTCSECMTVYPHKLSRVIKKRHFCPGCAWWGRLIQARDLLCAPFEWLLGRLGM